MPDKISFPCPLLVRAPLVAVETPERVRVVAWVMTSKVAVLPVLIVKLRSVLAVAPVYCRMPPSKTRLPAALVAAPRLPLTPPSPMVATFRMPPVKVVTPV